MKNTFKGSIQLEEVDGMYEPASEKVAKGLDEIVEKINERFKGDFTDADIVYFLKHLVMQQWKSIWNHKILILHCLKTRISLNS